MGDETASSSSFSLKSVFKFAAKVALVTIPLFFFGGMLDFSLLHDNPGVVAFYHTIKAPLQTFYNNVGITEGFNILAQMMGGGIEKMAEEVGGKIMEAADLGSVFIPAFAQ